MMSRAPASAASASGTSFSAETNSAAFAEHSEDWLLKMKSASGSSPLSRATVARVLRFGLNGWYMSSSFASVSAAAIAAESSSVRRLRSASDFFIASRLSSSALRRSSPSRIAAIATSSREPVASFLYRAINGTVAPSPRSLAVAATCITGTESSFAIKIKWFSFIKKFFEMMFQTRGFVKICRRKFSRAKSRP